MQFYFTSQIYISIADEEEEHYQVQALFGVWLKDKLKFVRNRRGKLNLIYDGYFYIAKRKFNSTVNWVCNKSSNTKLRCPARCVTAGENAIKLGRRPHNH